MSAAAQAAPEAVPAYFQVTLSRVVTLYNFVYRPGILHTVDGATLEALGDAVLTKTRAEA